MRFRRSGTQERRKKANRQLLAGLSSAAALLGSPAYARDLNTLDARFTICAWGKLKGCDLLDDRRLQHPSITSDERALVSAVMARVQRKVFDLKSLAAEFGDRAIVDTQTLPGATIALWTRDTPGSTDKTTIAFSGEKGLIQIAGISVPGKYTIRWCNEPEPDSPVRR
ncbi:hypothetical protein [Roseateles asaccharophilus]|uniref:Uncharacterized protein n=1 Tax=Roseateles asaccharophilus TaxID=582607 RepID=A0ABU2A1M8_9BURK|nr:hypothetical protein [Roseateles asaccharophilus]MDR7331102.1 hypothetical protein [Roseateles asaccharophilus]